MASMPPAEIDKGYAVFMAELSALGENTGALKSEVRQLYAAVDSWMDANKAAMNTAIPAAIRTKFTPQQKARMLIEVVARRYRLDI